ncbi:hypothetical protein BF49_2728 [Bradyrhizobium sp.]|nr:hypothetical protein BF49_2728 [Bradyrhizobium sp.]
MERSAIRDRCPAFRCAPCGLQAQKAVATVRPAVVFRQIQPNPPPI